MLLSEVEYERPATLAEGLRILASREGARALAGGQTLVNVMKLRAVSPDVVVDVTRIPELRGFAVDGEGRVEIGAATTYAEIAESDEVRALRPLVAEVAEIIADVQVRNRGTIGGNVCVNLPTSHFPPVTVALGATMVVAALDGEREVPAEAFFRTTFTTAVGRGEILRAVRFPAQRLGEGDAFVAMSAGKESQSIVHVACSLRLNGRVEEARVALGCVAPAPVRAAAVETALAGAKPGEEAVRAAVAGLGATLAPVGDVNASAEFKRHVAEVVTRRALLQALERAREARP